MHDIHCIFIRNTIVWKITTRMFQLILSIICFFTITDGTNNFVRLHITHASLSCVFINQSEESEKFCAIRYTPTTHGCTNLTLNFDDLKYFATMSDSSYIEIPLDSPADNICFIVVAGNGTKNIAIEGKNSLMGKSL